MKKDIHPEYFAQATISCACGQAYTVGSTVQSIQVDLCSNCHPFYTGKQKIIDTARRVEKFQARASKKAEKVVSKKEKRAKRAAKKKEQTDAEAKAE